MRKAFLIIIAVVVLLIGSSCSGAATETDQDKSSAMLVPNVVGMELEDAKSAIKASGLEVGNIEYIEGDDSGSDVKIELISEDRGGITNDGVSLYKMTIKDKFDINEMDFSEWSELPISDSIVDYYMIDTQEAGRCITSVENGSWKIIGKNKEEGIYRNIEIYVYDEDERCLYAYKWDS